MADKKSNLPFVLVVLGLLAGGGYYYYSTMPQTSIVDEAAVEEEQAAAPGSEQTADAAATGSIDVAAALSDRILGNPNAPIRITEHASLTCGHCGHFHKETFGKFKEAYIDTGKAYVVFSDFPLNAPALHASMIARCLPADKYYDFTSQLFQEQDQWAYESSYLTYLKAKAENFGMSADQFKACLNSKELQDGIVARITAVQKQWNISSTPSFVVNNKVVLGGAADFESFTKEVEEAAVKANSPTPEPEPAAGEPETTETPGAASP